jgi:hypothetical protein
VPTIAKLMVSPPSAAMGEKHPIAGSFPGLIDLVVGAQPALSRRLRGGYNKMRCGSPAMTFIDSTTCGAFFGGGRYR